jgi:hypothetical protein
MKVFVLCDYPYYDGGGNILGVYSTFEKALAVVEEKCKEIKGWDRLTPTRWTNSDYELNLDISEHTVED